MIPAPPSHDPKAHMAHAPESHPSSESETKHVNPLEALEPTTRSPHPVEATEVTATEITATEVTAPEITNPDVAAPADQSHTQYVGSDQFEHAEHHPQAVSEPVAEHSETVHTEAVHAEAVHTEEVRVETVRKGRESALDEDRPEVKVEAPKSPRKPRPVKVSPPAVTPAAADTLPDLQWFVLKVQSNREKSIKDSLVRRIKREGLEQYFVQIVIPMEKIVETKGGKRKVREQKLFPGYMAIQVRLTEETWYLVRDTSGVGDFTGSAGKPSPMLESEISRMLGLSETPGEEAKVDRPVVRFGVAVGDIVKAKQGSFEGFEGTVDKLDDATGKVKVIFSFLGRPTEVELDHWQVEKV